MDYKPFLTRDFKTLLESEPPKSRWQWGHLHWVVLVAFVAVVATTLILASGNATGITQATHSEQITPAEQTQPANNFIRIPLPIPQQDTPTPDAKNKTILPEHKTRMGQLDSKIKLNNDRLAALALPTNLPTLNIKIKAGDSLASIFKKHDLSAQTLHRIMKLGKATRMLRNIQPGQMLKIQLNANNSIEQLVYEIDKFNYLSVLRQVGQTQTAQHQTENFTARQITRQTEKRTHFAHGIIQNSLFEDGQAAGLSTTLIMEMANIFGWDIDFALDLRKGDHFSLLYEEHFLNGVKVQDGPVIAAQFTSQGRTYKAVRFTNENGFSSYYSPDGLSMRKAFLRTPVDFRRISSRFGKRRHPTLNRLRMHKGVDYVASSGTPVKASGDGKIIYRKRRGGYGKTVIIQHGGRYSTLYGHLKSFRRSARLGKKVKQGQIIGYVGSTGRATGPHLHYEFRVNGVHRNPLTIKLPNAAPIAKKYRKEFAIHATRMLAQLDSHIQTRVAARSH